MAHLRESTGKRVALDFILRQNQRSTDTEEMWNALSWVWQPLHLAGEWRRVPGKKQPAVSLRFEVDGWMSDGTFQLSHCLKAAAWPGLNTFTDLAKRVSHGSVIRVTDTSPRLTKSLSVLDHRLSPLTMSKVISRCLLDVTTRSNVSRGFCRRKMLVHICAESEQLKTKCSFRDF